MEPDATPKTDFDPGQYCPLTMSSQLVAGRWTLEIIRELLIGSSSFNDIARGVPGMSRTLLSTRLKQLEQAGVLARQPSGHYRLTDAGVALGPIVQGLAEWGEKWLVPEASLVGASVDFVMWDVRRHVRPPPRVNDRSVIRFDFANAPPGKDKHWLIFDAQGTDLCYLDPGFEVDLFIEVTFDDFAKIWRGERSLASMQKDELIVLHGDMALAKNAKSWLGIPVQHAT